jgi:hypothetical protein
MKTPENNSNKRPRKNSKTEVPVKDVTTKTPEEQVPLIEVDANMMKELLAQAAMTPAAKAERIKKHINDQKDAEAIRSVIQEYFTSFILVGYSVDNKRLIVKSTNSDKDEDALLEELRFVCFKLSGG